MKFLKKKDFKNIFLIFLVLITVTYLNLTVAKRKARDVQRRVDVGHIMDALSYYQRDFGFFPPSEDGKIAACKGENYDQVLQRAKDDPEFEQADLIEALAPCEYGEDSLRDIFDEEYRAYLDEIPKDPSYKKGFGYYYISNTRRYQIYAYLEGKENEIGYNESVIERGINCGVNICNYGRSFADTPVDISLEEYEKILLEKTLDNIN